ncbi:MAG: hypothetical protein WB811_02065 [Methanoregula sp.]|uniref:hypothetical protein n=1 Tax=Methanoregula sp. TaxID=2052170 RepID=UPI003BAE83D9
MPFVTAAKEFLEFAGELSDDKYVDVMTDTVGYLLENSIGIKNAVPTDTIVKVLKERGHKISRHSWEIYVLGKLRGEGIFIASNKNKGMYIIETREEAEKFYQEYRRYSRNTVENKRRLDLLSDLIEFGHWGE